MSFLKSIQEGYFTIVVEFTPHTRDDVVHVAKIAKGLVDLNQKYAGQKVRFAGISLTQNPGGNLSYDHLASLAILRENGFPEELEISPHVTGKDMNVDGIRSLLLSLCEGGVSTCLALTGDLSSTSKGVFEVDSIGLLQLVREINIDLLRKNRTPEGFAATRLITAGAAVSPFKYTEGTLAMQYHKARKKVREGAAFLTCQSGWDSARSEHLIGELADLGVPILGNALVVTHPAAKYMQTLAGCVVTDALLERLDGKDLDDALERAGQQLAMFRQLGYAGVDMGRPGEFKEIGEIEKVVDTALALGDWRAVRDNITFPAPQSPSPAVGGSASFSKFIHNLALDEKGPLHGLTKAALKPVENSAEHEGALYRLFNAAEGFGKGVLYQCEHCGDCFLPENDYFCTRGACEKGLNNPPCGDADPTGHCGNNANRICVAEKIYQRLKNDGGLESYARMTLPRRNPELDRSASLLNYFFGRDHTTRPNPLKGSNLIQIAELIHASIPLPGTAMQYVRKLGAEGFEKPNRGLLVLEYLIESQARQGADYIDLNIDALGDDNAPELMRRFVRLVHAKSGGTPPCIDSSDQKVLLAGLDEWFALTAEEAGARAPLVNSLPYMERDKFKDLLALRAKHPFSIICLLVGEEGPLKSTDEMVAAAREIFKIAKAAGFEPNQIFYDCVTLGIASDGCMDAMMMTKPSHTHNSFHAIGKIRNDPEMKGCHAVLGVSNWVYGATKRRIGHIRAFIAAAQKFGLDAAIVDVSHKFGITPASPELVGFVEVFVGLDGAEDSMLTYSAAMQNARASSWI